MSKVKVTANEHGEVVVVSTNNPEFAYIRVEQTVLSFNGAWHKPMKKSALIHGTVADLDALGWKKDLELPGKVVILESLEAPNPDDPTMNLKLAGDNGVVCTLGGKPIYRSSYYTPDETAQDNFIQHDNGGEIRSALKVRRDAASTATL